MKRARPGRRGAGGFTLIELLISVAILALLAGGAFSLAEVAARREREQDLRVALRQIREAIDAYKAAADSRHIRVAADETGYPRRLADLAAGVTDIQSPKGAKLYFLRRLPRDPMAEPALSAEASWGLRSYDSSPEDPQPGRDVYDVHSNSRGVGLDGRPYRDW